MTRGLSNRSKVAPPAGGNDDDLSSGDVVADHFDDSVSGNVAKVVRVERRSGQRRVT